MLAIINIMSVTHICYLLIGVGVTIWVAHTLRVQGRVFLDKAVGGTAGLADMCSIGKDLYFWVPDHSPRSLVEKVDYILGAGYLDGADAREQLGLGGGPQAVISNLAVLDFHPQSKGMRLKSVHPGTTVEEVRAATGFELLMPHGSVPQTLAPSQEQVRLIREDIDPDEMRKRGFR